MEIQTQVVLNQPADSEYNKSISFHWCSDFNFKMKILGGYKNKDFSDPEILEVFTMENGEFQSLRAFFRAIEAADPEK